MKISLKNLVQLSLIMTLFACMPEIVKKEQQERIHIIPIPLKMDHGSGQFVINSETIIVYQSKICMSLRGAQQRSNLINPGCELEYIANQINQKISFTSSFSLQKWGNPQNLPEANYILLQLDDSVKELGSEGYHLSVTPDRIIIESFTTAGVFYGYQTLRQLLPPAFEGNQDSINEWIVPSVDIVDTPRFTWRGNMLDPSRHFLPVEFIKKNLDYLAGLKMNRFHWHLTDDQGWRIEIKSLPKLIEVGAWRVDRNDEEWWGREPQHAGEVPTYGGYYTHEQIKEIINYASERHITVVPEINMPGHSQAAIASYPEISCDGGPYHVATGGVAKDNTYCPGKEETYAFVEKVMDEIITLFPSEYIHIGGDECNKESWQKCSDCQKRIKDNNLKDENELQSYFIKRVEKIVNARGKKIIGWDEILEGGLAPNATVMSWRGEAGGIEAVKAGHDVIMSPNQYCYLDLKQGDPQLEPELGYSQLLLSTAYSYNPVPNEFTPKEARHILGIQGNLWGESIQKEEHANYMLFPRMFAIAEVAWAAQKNRDFSDFINRLEYNLQRLDAQGINYAKSIYNVSVKPGLDEKTNQITVTMKSEIDNPDIRYTMNGKEPSTNSQQYVKPLVIANTTIIKARSFRADGPLGKITEKTIRIHKAVGKKVKMANPPDSSYDIGEYGLTDCIRGTKEDINEKWMGVEGEDFEAVIDMGQESTINKITTSFLIHTSKWIFPPEQIEVYVSTNGDDFTSVGIVNYSDELKPGLSVEEFSVSEKVQTRFIKIHARNIGICPNWHKGAGGKAWVFLDEIIVE